MVNVQVGSLGFISRKGDVGSLMLWEAMEKEGGEHEEE